MVRLIENNIEEYIAEIQNRNLEDYREVYKEVDKILEDVRKNKDEALKKYTLEFDKVSLDNFEVTSREI